MRHSWKVLGFNVSLALERCRGVVYTTVVVMERKGYVYIVTEKAVKICRSCTVNIITIVDTKTDKYTLSCDSEFN